MFRAICRITAESIIKAHGSTEKVANKLVDLCLKCVAAVEPPNEVGKELAKDFLRRQSQTQTAETASKPWLSLKPILDIERMELLFKPYNPLKGEIQSVMNHNKESSYSSNCTAVVQQPWLLMPAATNSYYKLYSPMKEGEEVDLDSFNGKEESSSKLVGSSQGWVASYKEGGSGELWLWNPVSGRRVELPPVLEEERSPMKVMVSCPQAEDEECRALMIYGSGRLAYCCPATSKRWMPAGGVHDHHYGLRCVRSYEDITYSAAHKRFLTLSEDHESSTNIKLETWDLAHLESPRLDTEYICDVAVDDDDLKKKKKNWCRAVRNLVVADQSNQVYVVTRYMMQEETIDCDVHKVRIKGRKLKYMKESLDGLAMFVGMKNECFAVPASQYTGLKPDSVYFTNSNSIKEGGAIIGIFDYINRRIATATAKQDSSSSSICPYIFNNHLQCGQQYHRPLWFTPTLYGAFLTYYYT